jgi:hypothetical protein
MYTDESWTTYQSAIETAQNVLDNDNATQEDIDKAEVILKNAADGLKAIINIEIGKISVDKAKLQSVYDDGKRMHSEKVWYIGDVTYIYTDKTWTNYQAALESAKKVLDNADATQDEVDKEEVNLKNAIDGLEIVSKQKNDKTKLQYLYDNNKMMHNQKVWTNGDTTYSCTDESWKNFEAALESAKEVLDNADPTQEDVNKAEENLKNAEEGLKIITK